MASENAKAVAKEIVKRVRNGQKVVLGEIIREQGYSQTVSESPTKVTETKTYKEEMRPVVEQLERERQRLITELTTRDLSKEEYRTMVEAMDKLTKNVQLLSGGATERHVLVLPSELINKHESDASTKSNS